MDDLRLSDRGKARLFPGIISREQAGLYPICTTENDWRDVPALKGAALRKFWTRVFERGANTLDGSEPDRLLAAWRLTRFMAVSRGVIQPNAPLGQTCEGPEVFFTDFRSFIQVPDWATKAILSQGDGVPLAPPRVAADSMRGREVAASYEPEKDERLVRFVQLVAYIGQAALMLDQSERSRRGFEWFIDPATIRAGWPSPSALFRFEAELVREASEIITDKAGIAGRREIAARWGLEEFEVSQLVFLTRRALATALDPDDLAGHKAVAIARLEAQYEKAVDALDHRGAAMIQREQWRILRDKGEAQVEDELGEMDGVIQAASARKRLSRPKDPS